MTQSVQPLVKHQQAEAAGLPVTRRKPVSHYLPALKRDALAWLLAVPTLFLFVIFSWEPILWQIVLSFFHFAGFTPTSFVGLNNYSHVLRNAAFQQVLTNTVIYVLWSLLIGWPLPLIVAILMNEVQQLRGFFRFAIYLPVVMPILATSYLWAYIYDPSPSGLLNRLLTNIGLPPSQWLQNEHLTILLIGITMTWGAFGGTTLLYLASLQGVNRELYETAALDGAGVWKRIWNVTLPQIAPIIKLFLVLQVIGVFQTFIQPFAMTQGGPNNASTTLVLQAYEYAFNYFLVGNSLATGTITFLILLVFAGLYQWLTREPRSR